MKKWMTVWWLMVSVSAGVRADDLLDFKLDNLRDYGASSSAAAEFRLWLPPTDTTLKYVLILTPGSNGDGRGWATDAAWQKFAADHDAALLACRFYSSNWRDYERLEWWSGKALLAAAKQAAQLGQHAELETVPWILWGHSAGGIFSYNVANWQPWRVAAFVVNKAGSSTTEPTEAVLHVPGIFMAGTNDSSSNFGETVQRYLSGRRRGAVWCFATEPNTGHEEGQTSMLSRAFFHSVIVSRSASAAGGDTSWLGDLADHDVFPKGGNPKNNQATTWLPDEAFAEKWKTFTTGGKIYE